MLFFKYMLLVTGIGMFVIAGAIVANDAWMIVHYRRKPALGAIAVEAQPLRWRSSVALVFLAWAPLLIALSIALVPGRMAGARQGGVTIAEQMRFEAQAKNEPAIKLDGAPAQNNPVH